ncbi:signal peptidase I [Streptosporangium algeriense]|uniref:Signal peptidase I n=1 Tax=Streptosporangium algeriense TaxID=1682748 RepID=A0ABW3DKS5_9ACTN
MDNARVAFRRLRVLLAVLLVVLTAGCGVVEKLAGRKGFRSGSEVMEPTIRKGQYFTVRTVDEDYVPKAGEVVLYRPPAYWSDQTPRPSADVRVSRVIGVPGSYVSCCDATGKVVVNGRSLPEPYVSARPASAMDFEVDVPPGRIWIMGDNRDVSLDSRAYQNATGHGTIAISDVVGVVDDIGPN